MLGYHGNFYIVELGRGRTLSGTTNLTHKGHGREENCTEKLGQDFKPGPPQGNAQKKQGQTPSMASGRISRPKN